MNAALARRLVLTLLAALAALLATWHAVRHGAPALALLAIALLPWLFLLRGLVDGQRRAYAIASLLTIPYLGYGLMEVLANPGARPWAAATVFLAFALFVALVAFLRLSRTALPAPSARTAP